MHRLFIDYCFVLLKSGTRFFLYSSASCAPTALELNIEFFCKVKPLNFFLLFLILISDYTFYFLLSIIFYYFLFNARPGVLAVLGGVFFFCALAWACGSSSAVFFFLDHVSTRPPVVHQAM